ncbi:MAG TPA: YlxR family protein [Chloroflexota bacterium]|nr:YlxR family protein [Chloroflexota bacterium]
MAEKRPRHIPMRTCVGCRQEQPKRQLVRLVRTPEGRVLVDPTGKAPGRGAYLCRQPACWNAALRRSALAGALRTTLSAEDRAALERFRDTLGAPEAAPVEPG